MENLSFLGVPILRHFKVAGLKIGTIDYLSESTDINMIEGSL